MPRIYTSASDPVDFCRECFPDLEDAQETYGLEAEGEGPDDRGDCFAYEAEHPPYDECDYDCEICGERLGDDDD